MKKKRTAQSAFLNLGILVGLIIFFTGILFALFAASPMAWTPRGETNLPASTHPTAGMIDGVVVATRSVFLRCRNLLNDYHRNAARFLALRCAGEVAPAHLNVCRARSVSASH